jgi:hypothetical protein
LSEYRSSNRRERPRVSLKILQHRENLEEAIIENLSSHGGLKSQRCDRTHDANVCVCVLDFSNRFRKDKCEGVARTSICGFKRGEAALLLNFPFFSRKIFPRLWWGGGWELKVWESWGMRTTTVDEWWMMMSGLGGMAIDRTLGQTETYDKFVWYEMEENYAL